MSSFEIPFDRRRAGVLLHPTSLPGFPQGRALVADAGRFMQFLADAGFTLWQMLPVHPVDAGGSPYHSCSVHAGDPRLIAGGSHEHIIPAIDSQAVAVKVAFAFASFNDAGDPERQEAYGRFKSKHSYWLDDYARFRVLKSRHDDAPWWLWPEALRRRRDGALAALDGEAAADLEHFRFEQFLFFEQWSQLRRRAAELGIALCGDMPIFSAHDSADLWTHPEYYLLDDDFQPKKVAGVPPDYFSETGQHWGNPVYDWGRMAADGYRWWMERFRTELELFDCIRLDHFRGYAALWHIPADADTAVTGEWCPGPGESLFAELQTGIGKLPVIAEDLGMITEDVIRLRRSLAVPGMLVLQFAFDGDPHNPYLPHNHVEHALVCTGTHDNNTTLGWFEGLPAVERERVLRYLGAPGEPMPWPLLRAALASVAGLAVLPMQDVLSLGGEHRLNTPGTTAGNWQWRFSWDWLHADLAADLRELNALYGRR